MFDEVLGLLKDTVKGAFSKDTERSKSSAQVACVRCSFFLAFFRALLKIRASLIDRDIIITS